ncbi:hypothetical protein M728_001568 [Ensifer sp. WSM1721]
MSNRLQYDVVGGFLAEKIFVKHSAPQLSQNIHFREAAKFSHKTVALVGTFSTTTLTSREEFDAFYQSYPVRPRHQLL